jgi:hypothetical protein
MEDAGNTRHLVVGIDITTDTIVDGLTITESIAGGRTDDITINTHILYAWEGGGIYTANCDEDLKFINVNIKNNFSMYGAGVFNNNSSPSFSNCTIMGNSATDYGGGMSNSGTSSPVIRDTQIVANQAGIGGAGISYCLGHPLNTHRPLTTTCNIDIQGGEIRGNITIGTGGGGGIYSTTTGTASLTNVRISGNRSSSNGGGVYISGLSSLELINTELSGNQAGTNGGGLYAAGTIPAMILTNITVAGNFATNGGGINLVRVTSGTINNSIIWGNTGVSDVNLRVSAGSVTLKNSLVGITGYTAFIINGVSNLLLPAAPLFVTAAIPPAPSSSGNYTLLSGSPCIDTGDSILYPGPALDLAGNSRINGAGIDMGAYEF